MWMSPVAINDVGPSWWYLAQGNFIHYQEDYKSARQQYVYLKHTAAMDMTGLYLNPV